MQGTTRQGAWRGGLGVAVVLTGPILCQARAHCELLGRAPPGRLRAGIMRNSWHEGLAGDPTLSLPLGAVAGAAGGKAQEQARRFHGAHGPKVPTAVVPGECRVRKGHVLMILGASLGTQMWQPRNCCQAVAARLVGGRRRGRGRAWGSHPVLCYESTSGRRLCLQSCGS